MSYVKYLLSNALKNEEKALKSAEDNEGFDHYSQQTKDAFQRSKEIAIIRIGELKEALKTLNL